MSTSDLATFLEQLGLENVVDYGNEIGARCLKHRERTGYEENNPRHWFINVRTTEHHCFSCGYKGNLRSLVLDLCDGDVWKASGLLKEYTEEHMFRPFEAEQPEVEKRDLPPEVVLMSFSWPTERALRVRKISLEACMHFGIRWDAEDPAWVFPIRSPEFPHPLWGWQMKQRNLVRNRPRSVQKSHTFFGIDAVALTGEIVLVESPLDVARLFDLGYPALASFGAEVSKEQMTILKRSDATVILGLDNDPPGIRSMTQLAKEYAPIFTRRMKVLNYSEAPDAKDVGEMTDDQIHSSVRDAISLPEWEKYVCRGTSRVPKRSSGQDGRAKSAARRLSARSGKDRAVNRGHRTPHRRG